jgi:exodeoxyribonuclease-5
MIEATRQLTLAEAADGVILCATQRLARHLRRKHDDSRRAAGCQTWSPLLAVTLDGWLSQVTEAAVLDGSVPPEAMPRLALDPAQLQILWEQAIAADGEPAELFDREGLAALAAEADELVETWSIVQDGAGSDETAAFRRWRQSVHKRCRERRWAGAAGLRAWRIACIERGAGRLPQRVTFAGFDRYSPQDAALARVLGGRGVEIARLAMPLPRADATVRVLAVADARAECRSVAAWAAECLRARPGAHLGIVVPQLAALRPLLVAALDDALHAETLLVENAAVPRRYNVSLGIALDAWPVVAAALSLLRLAAQPRRIEQTDLASLLNGPFWSVPAEADGRARFDAAMREHLPPQTTLTDILRLGRRQVRHGLPMANLLAHLEAIAAASARSREAPSAWATRLPDLLNDFGWPGGRSLSSHEWQAVNALRETCRSLASLDDLLGPMPLTEAVGHLGRLCRQRVFQPQTEGRPAVDVLGPLEAAGVEFDALWVMGMSDDVWPPPPRPNPLLPAAAQRSAGAPNASAEVQLAYARAIHGRLLASAPDVTFSWPEHEGDRTLRPSPLLEGLSAGAPPDLLPTTLEQQVAAATIGCIDDHRAPALPAGTLLAGGVGVLRAQALCPAWACFRYRLAAAPLAEPAHGLTPAERGSLLHRTMEVFWQGRDSVSLAALPSAERHLAAMTAAAAALAHFNGRREVPLSARFVELERERLATLLEEWIAVELARPQAFTVIACEQALEADLAGLRLNIRVDRVDELADGRRLIIDYKSSDPGVGAWLDQRLAEPQLPAYASLCQPAPSGIAFARVRAGDSAHVALCAAADLLARARVADDWPAQLRRWQEAVSALAAEVLAGEAAIVFGDEAALRYCEVLPLLRLPEVRQWREGR